MQQEHHLWRWAGCGCVVVCNEVQGLIPRLKGQNGGRGGRPMFWHGCTQASTLEQGAASMHSRGRQKPQSCARPRAPGHTRHMPRAKQARGALTRAKHTRGALARRGTHAWRARTACNTRAAGAPGSCGRAAWASASFWTGRHFRHSARTRAGRTQRGAGP